MNRLRCVLALLWSLVWSLATADELRPRLMSLNLWGAGANRGLPIDQTVKPPRGAC